MAGKVAVKKAVRRPRGCAGYIQSSQWKELRREAIDRDGGRCRVCDRKERLEVHHRKYPSAWKFAKPCGLANLSLLCKNETMYTDTFHHKTYIEAHEARARLRAQYPNFLARIEPSPYGEGYRIRLTPASFVVRGLIGYPPAGTFDRRRKS